MPANQQPTPIEQQLAEALDDLAAALKQASEAAATIRNIAPQIAATGSVLQEIEALLRAGGPEAGSPGEAPGQPGSYKRPTLVVPAASVQRPRSLAKRKPEAAPGTVEQTSDNGYQANARLAEQDESAAAEATGGTAAAFPSAADDPGVSCFRLEFESVGGPLDLRAIDDAVTQHPAVRDVALLDYDGRRAMLKVWITAGSSPADVQSDLKERIPQLLAPGTEVRVVALEDVA
ncbi:MAG: hypothetical protein M3P30_10620 [Chloroflexota bacterium]|nr:hypothetical protein [Chloroflexota bacterium]